MIADPTTQSFNNSPSAPMRGHLKRLSNTWTDHPQYFLTCCTNQRSKILDTNTTHQIFRKEWENALPQHGWQIGRYVIMPDHVHFFASPNPEAKSLSAFMQQWKQWTSKGILKHNPHLQPPIWQKEYFDHLLRSEESLSEKWDYVRLNPVRANLVSNPEDYPHQGFIHFQ